MGGHNEEVLSIVKVAKLNHHLVAVHVCLDSGSVSKESPLKQENFLGLIFRGSFGRKFLRRVRKHCAAMAAIVGKNPDYAFQGWISLTRNCMEQLPLTDCVLAFHNHKGRIIFERPSIYQHAGFKLYSRPKDPGVSINEKPGSNSEAGKFNLYEYREGSPLTSVSTLYKEMLGSSPGWPLLQLATPAISKTFTKSDARELSVVEWVMSLPDRSNSGISQVPWDLGSNRTGKSPRRKTDDSMAEEWDMERTSPHAIQISEDKSVNGSSKRKDKSFGLTCRCEAVDSSNSVSTLKKESSLPGWPLLKKAVSAAPEAQRDTEARKISVVQWVMNLPNRTTPSTQQTPTGIGSSKSRKLHQESSVVERELGSSGAANNDEHCSLPPSRKLPKELVLKTNSSSCKRFSYKELMIATSQFSSDNLIGEGGCSSVYKGYLPGGKPVAIKVSKLYKEAWSDFSLEVEIVSSLKHKHITPLIGVCFEDDHLISVYDFLPKGSLEENLHGNGDDSVLTWEMRFKVAVVVAEALNYLHNECSEPVIHRDVKSSNVLFTHDYQPQLSDFGLAVWGQTDSTYLTYSDVVGTFGYIAPEYFMHGMVSNKIDVYSFGVVLLELVSGRKPISWGTLIGQESLVKWATSILERGEPKLLLDPKLDGNFDVVQMRRMVMAASLCINQSAQLRPNASQILKLLKGEQDAED